MHNNWLGKVDCLTHLACVQVLNFASCFTSTNTDAKGALLVQILTQKFDCLTHLACVQVLNFASCFTSAKVHQFC